jgi:hypothetical protein
LRSAWAKSARLYLKNRPGIMVHHSNPSYSEGEGRGTMVQAGPGKSTRPYLNNKLKAKGLGASGRAQQAYPEFNP